MENILYSTFGILIPFIGTSLGSGLVFFIKKDIGPKIKKLIVGFASRSYDCSKYMVTYSTINRNG